MSKQSLIKLADKLFAAWFHSEFKTCAICGESPIEMHHLIRRNNYLFRWVKMNVIPLDPFHHKHSRLLSAHGAPDEFAEWLRVNRPDQYEFWQKNKYITGVSLKEDWYRDQLERIREEI